MASNSAQPVLKVAEYTPYVQSPQLAVWAVMYQAHSKQRAQGCSGLDSHCLR